MINDEEQGPKNVENGPVTKDGKGTEQGDDHNFPYHVEVGSIPYPNCDQTKEQSKDHSQGWLGPRPGFEEAKWYPGNECKNQKPNAIFLYVARVQIAFRKHERHDGAGESSDEVKRESQRIRCGAKAPSQMVYEHGDDGNILKLIPVERDFHGESLLMITSDMIRHIVSNKIINSKAIKSNNNQLVSEKLKNFLAWRKFVFNRF